MKFSTKIFLLFLVFVLAIFLPIGGFLYHIAAQATLEQIKQNLQKQVDYNIEKIDWMLFERSSDIKILANSIIKYYLYSQDELSRQLAYVRNTYQIYSSLAFFDQNQIKIADTSGHNFGNLAPDTLWRKEVYEQGMPSLAHDVHFSKEIQKIVVTFATPVWGDDILLGALVAEVPIENILLQSVEIGEKEYTNIDLVNKTGILLYSNYNTQHLLQQVIQKNSAAFGHKESVYTFATERGYLTFPGNGWTLIIQYPKTEVFKPLTELRNRITLYSLLLLFFALLAVSFFAHRIIKPVKSLQIAAQQLGQGNFDISIPLKSKDEIGELTQAFNQTAHLLNAQFTELKQFRTLLDMGVDNIFILDAKNLRFLYINNNVITTMGYTREEMLRMSPMDIDVAQSNEKAAAILESLGTGKLSVARFESIHRCKNGKTFPVEIAIQYVFLSKQNQYYVCVVRDITERKRTEQLLQEYSQRLEQEIAVQTEELLTQTKALEEKNRLLQQESQQRQQIAINLQQKEEFLRLIIDNIPQLIFWKDINSVFLGCNQHAADLNNLPHPKDLIGKTDYELVWSQYADKYRQDDQRVMENDQAELRIVEQFVTQQGEKLWMETNKIPLHNIEGEVIGILGTSENITLRRQAEQVLQEYNQRLREEIASQTEELEVQNEELTAQTEQLEEKTHLLQQEILQRQEIEIALRESEERFALAMAGANDGLWDWNLITGEIYYSKRWKEMLGFAENELPDKPEIFFERIHPDDKEIMEKTVANYTSKRASTYEATIRLRHKDGNYRWILTRAVGLWNRIGKAVRLVGTHVDLTKQKQIESALAASERRFRDLHEKLRDGVVSADLQGKIIGFNPAFVRMLSDYTPEELYQMTYQELTPVKWHQMEEKIVQEQVMMRGYSDLYEKEYIRKDGSTVPIEIQIYLVSDSHNKTQYFWKIVRDISERRHVEQTLQHAKEAAEIANQAKSTFLANMSHELRTPLNGILGYAQILNRDSSLTEKQKEGVSIIQRSGQYLLNLINDILDLAKIEAGRIELYETDIYFDEFIQSIVQLFKIRAEQKGIAFFYERTPHLPLGIRADEKRLRQVLINLLGNAVKFTETGGITLKIIRGEDYLHFNIEDTGVGIAQEELDSIFQPFQQVGNQNQRAEGTGLGLSITKRLVEKMGGILSVRSILGVGSNFQITLPLVEISDLIINITEPEPVIVGFEGKVRRILVIDDKSENRSVLINLLTPLGFKLSEASHGQQGLEQLQETQIDIVLTDLVMPVMDGFEFTRRCKKIPQFRHIPVIAVSASVFEYHQQQSAEAGCDDFIPKPIDADILLKKLQQYLDLIWIYESHKLSQTQIVQSLTAEFVDTTHYPLATEQAALLHRLGLEGDVAAILEIVEQLRTQEELLPLAKKVEQLTKNFDTDSVSELMESYLN